MIRMLRVPISLFTQFYTLNYQRACWKIKIIIIVDTDTRFLPPRICKSGPSELSPQRSAGRQEGAGSPARFHPILGHKHANFWGHLQSTKEPTQSDPLPSTRK